MAPEFRTFLAASVLNDGKIVRYCFLSHVNQGSIDLLNAGVLSNLESGIESPQQRC